MIKRILALSGTSIAIGLIVCSTPEISLAQQRQANPAPQARAGTPATRATYTPPKTPWGEPDLQGMWPLNHLINTPFQRPEKYGERRLMTDEEYAAAQK